MAYDASNEERIEIGRVKKNDRGDYIVVSLVKSNGSEAVDARMFCTTDNNEVIPTKKGFRINAEFAGDLAALFQKIADEDYA